MQVQQVDDFNAVCEAKGVTRDVSLFMLQGEEIDVGDYVLVHVGYAIQKVSPENAAASWELIDEVLNYNA
jgi:hydrogenase expression/formation protein HypC